MIPPRLLNSMSILNQGIVDSNFMNKIQRIYAFLLKCSGIQNLDCGRKFTFLISAQQIHELSQSADFFRAVNIHTILFCVCMLFFR